jgi:hypothetical protein
MYQTIQVYIRSQSTLELKWANKVHWTKVIVLVKNLLVQWELWHIYINLAFTTLWITGQEWSILLKYTTDNH